MTDPLDPLPIVAASLENASAIIAASVVSLLPLPAACALIQMESGGQNIYGHDKGGVFSVPGQELAVTEENFTSFLARVMGGATSNGVGPCQITYAGTLKGGKRDGGYFTQMAARGLKPWVPLDNCRFGFELMAANLARFSGSYEQAGAAYNGGTRPDASAVAYGKRFAALVDEWTTRLQGVPMPKYPPPSPPFVAAKWHGGAQTPAKRIVIHGTVSPCEPGGARNIAHFFATETNKTSAHYVVDPGEVIQCVGDHTVAYHAPPNQDSIGVELCDPVTGSASRWNDQNHSAMLERAADLVAQLALAYAVPIRKITSGQLVAGQHGICGHVDVSNAWHQTTHTDPGAGFPWDRFIGLVQTAADRITGNTPPDPKKPTPPAPPEDDMTPDQLHAALDDYEIPTARGKVDKPTTLPALLHELEETQDRHGAALADLDKKLDDVLAALNTLAGTAPDVAAIRAKVVGGA